MEVFSGNGVAAVGTNKTIINLFNSSATPTRRGQITYVSVGSNSSPANQQTDLVVNRSTGIGTEGSGFTPINIDASGPAVAEYDIGVAHTVEPTYTAGAELLPLLHFQLAFIQWVAQSEKHRLLLPATQNVGAGLYAKSSSGTPNLRGAFMFIE